MIYRLILPIVLLLTAAGITHAQRIDTIKANPDAKPLRKIWQVTGGATGGGRVGEGFGSCGDINQDGYEDWAVHYGTANEWRIYYGSDEPLSTNPVVILDSLGAFPVYPVVGDFWGTSHKAVAFPSAHTRSIDGNPFYFFELHIFRTDSNRLDTVPTAILDPDTMTPFTTVGLQSLDIKAIDLDGDNDDELIVMTHGVGRGSAIVGLYPEVWIYRGGLEFQVDSPTVILRDTEKNGGNKQVALVSGHLDDDDHIDLITSSPYADGVSKVKFYFGREGSPWNWTEPDRVVPMGGFTPLDCDGDGVLDMLVGGEDYRVSLFLSGSGKDIRTRTLTSNDLDLTFRASTYYCVPNRLGYISDSSRRYDVLTINVGGVNYLFSGGPNGPDAYYDGYTGDLFGGIRPIGDINGDGWDEVMSGNSTVNFEAGYAAVFAGGPYIPHDPSLSVRAVAGEGRSDAITIWPNPATTELHIAWRGDLKRMPRSYRIHDINGALVAQGETPSWRGEMLWQCGDVAAGNYVLSIYDWQWQLLATTTITKV